jgi:hypothetical protein
VSRSAIAKGQSPGSIDLQQDGVQLLAEALGGYLQEVERYRAICQQHQHTAAIHMKGKELQIYRLFDRSADATEQLRTASELLPPWEESVFWKYEGDAWKKLHRDVEARMKKHQKLMPILTKGIEFNNLPMLIHAYKFEPDPMMKVELIVPHSEAMDAELPLRILALALECHDYLLPAYVTHPLPPYTRHETKFATVWEYLSATMPPELFASQASTVPREGVLPRQKWSGKPGPPL